MTRKISWEVVSNNYDTYRDEQLQEKESHLPRLGSYISISIVIAVSVKDLSDDNISVLVTFLSILIGFAFAAMFPIALEGVSGLPKPMYSEDRDDIRVIRQLAEYFRHNVAYFIPLALACVGTLLVQMLSFNLPDSLKIAIRAVGGKSAYFLDAASEAGGYVPNVVLAVSVFMIQECCYTFYRMCFNALALLRIKEEYMNNRPVD